MKKILLSITLVMLFCSQSLAETSVWKLTKGESVIYLGGTCHLLRQTDYPLPAEFDKAYRASELLVFETDLGEFSNPLTQQKLMSQAMYNDGTTIDHHLSSQTYGLLSEYCASNNIPLEVLKKFKPSMVAITITVMELARLGVARQGVDHYYYGLALKDKKAVEGLETVDEQIHFIVGMGAGNEEEFVAHSIKEISSIKQQYERFVDAWKKGDTEALNTLMVVELQTQNPRLYKMLITDRNKKWLPMIDAYQQTPRKAFILVGAGHLVGPDGLIAALRKNGYKVDKL